MIPVGQFSSLGPWASTRTEATSRLFRVRELTTTGQIVYVCISDLQRQASITSVTINTTTISSSCSNSLNESTNDCSTLRSIDCHCISRRLEFQQLSNQHRLPDTKQCAFPSGQTVYSQLRQRHGIYCFCKQLRRVLCSGLYWTFTYRNK